jgi:hypothetical protein
VDAAPSFTGWRSWLLIWIRDGRYRARNDLRKVGMTVTVEVADDGTVTVKWVSS